MTLPSRAVSFQTQADLHTCTFLWSFSICQFPPAAEEVLETFAKQFDFHHYDHHRVQFYDEIAHTENFSLEIHCRVASSNDSMCQVYRANSGMFEHVWARPWHVEGDRWVCVERSYSKGAFSFVSLNMAVASAGFFYAAHPDACINCLLHYAGGCIPLVESTHCNSCICSKESRAKSGI